MEDIRWHQRLSNYSKALDKLKNNINYIKDMYDGEEVLDEDTYTNIALEIEDIYKQGLIQSFEFTHELAWKVMQDFAKDQGNTEIRGSKDAVRYAAKINLIQEAQQWMNMILDRNETSHTYNEDTANQIFVNIIVRYLSLLQDFELKMEEIRSGEQQELF